MIKLDMMNAHELLKDMTILYVDDDEDALEIVNEHLSTKIKKLYTSSNPLDAIDKYKSIRPDIIITDIRMPIMNGFEMIKKIREMAPMVKVIYTSAYSSKDYILKSFKDDADDYIAKPILEEELQHTLQKVAKLLYKGRKVKAYNKFIKLILDSQENLVAVTSDTGLLDTNQQILNFFGFSSMQEFKEANTCISYKFIKDRNFIYRKETFSWLDDVLFRQPAKVKMRDKNQKEHIFLVKCTPFIMNDKNPHYIVTFTNITDLEEHRGRLEALSLLDSLTAVYNRVHFNHLLKKHSMIYKKDKKAFSIMLIDIDNFRKVNENFGYIAGDKILIDIAYELKKLVRDTDILARWAGEEFIILLPDTDHIAAKHVAEKINTHMKKCDFTVDECGECSITCSIIMTSSKDGDDENTIIKRVESHIQDVANKENIFIEI